MLVLLGVTATMGPLILRLWIFRDNPLQIRDFQIDVDPTTFDSPHCIVTLRPWVNVGNVGRIVVNRLGRIYGAKKIGELMRPGKFYDHTRYRPRIRMRRGERTFRIPNTEVTAARVPDGRDLIFVKMLEPHAWAEDFNDSILELLQAFNVERYVLVGSMYDSVPHTRPLKVTGSARGWEPPSRFRDGVRLGRSRYEGPTSMASQLTELARTQLHLETLSMIAHLPLYLKLDNDYVGAARVLSVLSEIYNVPMDRMPEIRMGETQYSQVQISSSDNPRLAQLVARLELEYDGEEVEPTEEEEIELSPELEEFLQDLSRGWDEDEGRR